MTHVDNFSRCTVLSTRASRVRSIGTERYERTHVDLVCGGNIKALEQPLLFPCGQPVTSADVL